MSKFGENLKRARALKGMNQEELAYMVGIKQASISQFERGERIPTPKNLTKLADALDVTIKELTGEESGVIGQTQLMRKVKGLSLESLDHLSKVADFLQSQENQ